LKSDVGYQIELHADTNENKFILYRFIWKV